MNAALLWALVAVPLGAGALLITASVARAADASGRLQTPPADRLAAPAALAASGVTTALAVLAALNRPAVSAPFLAGLPVGLRVDGLSAVLVVLVAAITLAVLVFSAAEIERARARFFGLMLVFSGGMLVTVTAVDLLTLLLGWEVMGATSYALIAFWWREPRRVRAGTTAFVTTRAADLGLYAAAGAALAGTGSLAFTALPDNTGWPLHLLTAGVLVAALGKSAQLPFTFWLSRAMEGPSPVSALLHSATMVAAGGYLLVRLTTLLDASGWGAPTTAWTGVGTATLLGAVAVAQRDLKQLLAASTAAQIGFVVLAAGVGAVAGGAEHLVAHAATKSLLFLGAGAWLTALGTKQLDGVRGAARRYPAVGAAFTVGALALAGLPPLSLWVTKDEVLAGAYADSAWLYGAGLLAAALSAAYAVKAVLVVLAPRPAPATLLDTEQQGTRHVPVVVPAVLATLATAAAGFAVLGLPVVADRVRTLLGASGEALPSGWQLALSAAVALGTAAVVPLGLRGRLPALPSVVTRSATDWLWLERAAQLAFVRPGLALATALARFDDRILAAVPGALARGGLALADRLGRIDVRGVAGAVRQLADGTAELGRLARRPQTGQLHQYYAQAAVLLVAATVLLLLVRP